MDHNTFILSSQLLEVKNLSKTFGSKQLLNNISFSLQTGDVLAIFGRNGCGKSTLLKMLFGTQKADSIQMSLNGTTLLPKNVIPNGTIAYLPQQPFLPKSLRVRDIIPLYFEDSAMQDKLFYAPNIHKIANTRAGSLSMGELRYLELLLVGNLGHPFLMLDEPFAMVEPLLKDNIKEFLARLQQEKGIIVTDHYYRDVVEISTKNLLLKDAALIPVHNENQLRAEGYLPG